MSEPLDTVAIAPCGCARGWISGKESLADYKKELRAWAVAGYEIRKMATEAVRALPWGDCGAPDHPQPKSRKATHE